MVDLATTTIQQLFEQQVRNLTLRTIVPKEELLDFQFSRGWAE